jgi:hypothetical protein
LKLHILSDPPIFLIQASALALELVGMFECNSLIMFILHFFNFSNNLTLEMLKQIDSFEMSSQPQYAGCKLTCTCRFQYLRLCLQIGGVNSHFY